MHFVALVGSQGRPSADREFSWRLLGSNNRELGRGSSSALTLPGAVSTVEQLRASLASHQVVHQRAPRADGWHWVLRAEGADVVHSARTFRRERESIYNADAFLAAFPIAEIRLPENGSKLPHVRSGVFLALREPPVVVAR